MRFSSSSAGTLFSSTVNAPILLLSQRAKIVGPGPLTVSSSFLPSACSLTVLAKDRRTRCENGSTSVAPDLVNQRVKCFATYHSTIFPRDTYAFFTPSIVSGKTTFWIWSSVPSTSSDDQCPCNTAKPFFFKREFVFLSPRIVDRRRLDIEFPPLIPRGASIEHSVIVEMKVVDIRFYGCHC